VFCDFWREQVSAQFLKCPRVHCLSVDELVSELTNCLSIDELASELTNNCLSVDEFASELTNCLSVDEFASELTNYCCLPSSPLHSPLLPKIMASKMNPMPVGKYSLLVALISAQSLFGGYWAATRPDGAGWRFFSWHPLLMMVGR
jgi:hypothetical protein